MVAPGTHPIYKEFAEALDLVEAKAHDYAEDDNVFSNFEFAAQVAGVTTEQVFAVLLGVKVARLGQLIGQGKVPNFESVDDTLLDTMNYAGLLKAFIRQEAEDMTISDAMDEALTGDPEMATAWEKYKAEAEAQWARMNEKDEGTRGITKRPEGIVLNPTIGLGDIIRLTPAENDDHRSEFRYEVVMVQSSLGKIEAVPTKDWQESLGEGIRQFGVDQVELA